MPFFQDDIADIVQMISLPVEIMGASLTAIEIFNKPVAERIGNKIEEISKASLNEMFNKLYNPVSYACIALVAVICFTSLMGYTQRSFTLPNIITAAVGSFAIATLSTGFLLAFLALFLYWLISILRFFDRITNGYPLGGFGITLGFLGVCGEIYQVLCIFFAESLC